jgi:quercetin 2,3-dioxygenase
MDRKTFLRKSFLSGVMVTATGAVARVFDRHAPELRDDIVSNQVGFNHLPNPKSGVLMNNMVFHKADSRGHANHGWLDSHHSFSFANYYNPDRMHFGVLRVLNDDHVEGSMGFGTHPHDNMEIISIPLSGDLEHRDSMGNIAVIKQGDVQIMSAGTGIYHSEKNKNVRDAVKFLQIWVFPKARNIQPRYDQKTFAVADRQNRWQNIVSPTPEKDGGVLINQDAWFHLGKFTANENSEYTVKKAGNGVYAFLLSGKATINGQAAESRDAVGIWSVEKINISVTEDSEILLIEVPMAL